jgi:O-antigen ligase
MGNILDYLKNPFQGLKEDNKYDVSLILALLVLVSIPLSYACNSVAVILFASWSFLKTKKKDIVPDLMVLLPVALFLLMCLSWFWSINPNKTLGDLTKNLPLLIIPCVFTARQFKAIQLASALKYYSHFMVLLSLFYVGRAFIKFIIGKDTSVFFYHELVTKDVNAIHVSVYIAIAFFYFLIQKNKTFVQLAAMLVLATVIMLLSSKTIIAVFMLLIAVYYIFFAQIPLKTRLLSTIAFAAAVAFCMVVFSNIKDRFAIELKTAFTENTLNSTIGSQSAKVYNVSIGEAWESEQFNYNDYFPGTAFRVFQVRIFMELLQEEPAMLKGYGLNAAQGKIQAKAYRYNVYPEYRTYNFHNQYIQYFAELGILGLILLVIMLGITFKNAYQHKDFIHIAFAILMITLFLTESFLSRQRGIVFFIMFYCLFNTSGKAAIVEKEII